MKHHLRLPLISSMAVFALCLASSPTGSAITITPTGTSFGSLQSATFGGTGIPNNAVEMTVAGNITLGLTATQRFANPAVTNDGAGTFFAVAGGDTLNSAPTWARWNFDFYIGGLSTGQSVVLYYDNNAAVGNNVTDVIPFPNPYYPGPVIQDSWNLGYSFLNGGIFDPNANGEYGFALVAFDVGGGELGRSAIQVKVGSVPDGGSTVLMLGSALILGLYFRRRAGNK